VLLPLLYSVLPGRGRNLQNYVQSAVMLSCALHLCVWLYLFYIALLVQKWDNIVHCATSYPMSYRVTLRLAACLAFKLKLVG
jgi:hypothetical protein